ncbi:Hypothetical predicted protein [Marmota monax]|uniref:Uncharacterized protein n=1 Tax=Marmota monax TaxID=9995 RepID=A0A5E4BUA9_MARMO|nr:Hypothetical predicted protein [Marmota monax]
MDTRAPPLLPGEPGGRGSGRWGLRGAALPPSSAPTDRQAAAAREGAAASGFVAAARAAGPGRPGARRSRPALRSPRPSRPLSPRVESRPPRSRLAGPSPGLRGRRAAPAG